MRMLILLGALAVAGCAQGGDVAKFNALQASCPHATKPGEYLARARCLNAASVEAGFKGPGEDLLNATRLRLGEQVDAGQITGAEANEQLADLRYKLARDRQADINAAIQAMPQPHSVTCNRIGAMTNCSGY